MSWVISYHVPPRLIELEPTRSIYKDYNPNAKAGYVLMARLQPAGLPLETAKLTLPHTAKVLVAKLSLSLLGYWRTVQRHPVAGWKHRAHAVLAPSPIINHVAVADVEFRRRAQAPNGKLNKTGEAGWGVAIDLTGIELIG